MIRHIFKIIWNERKSNGWIIVEFIVVFCILWFCIDYLSFIVKSNSESLGFDIDYTYEINMEVIQSEYSKEQENIDNYAMVQTFMTRVKQYPGVRNVCIAQMAVPYVLSTSRASVISLPDSVSVGSRIRYVSTEYFDVFKIPLIEGRIFDWTDQAESKNVVISADRNGRFGYPNGNFAVSDFKRYMNNDKKEYNVIGIVNPVKDSQYSAYENSIFLPVERESINLAWDQIIMRVSPHAGNDFAERFVKDMREQLNIGPYYLASVNSMENIKKSTLNEIGIVDNLNSVYAITSFLVINIFLGIIGTFWYRVQSRRSEIGTRLSMGATKSNIRNMLFTETLLLLFIAGFVAVNICLNIAQTDFLEAINVPKAKRTQAGIGIEQDFLNFFITYLFLAMISLLAIWYPARQAISLTPAEVLREE